MRELRTVKFAVGWRITCSSSDELSDSESEPVAKNLLMFNDNCRKTCTNKKQNTNEYIYRQFSPKILIKIITVKHKNVEPIGQPSNIETRNVKYIPIHSDYIEWRE